MEKKSKIILGIIIAIIIASSFWYINKEKESNIGTDEELPTSNEYYQGRFNEGESAKIFEFRDEEYRKALATDKLIVLYFYASWCPICNGEFPRMQQAFAEMDEDRVIGFRVHFNDDQTGQIERDLAYQYGVAYQHTKVFIKNGEKILKAPDTWDKAKYVEEIGKYL